MCVCVRVCLCAVMTVCGSAVSFPLSVIDACVCVCVGLLDIVVIVVVSRSVRVCACLPSPVQGNDLCLLSSGACFKFRHVGVYLYKGGVSWARVCACVSDRSLSCFGHRHPSSTSPSLHPHPYPHSGSLLPCRRGCAVSTDPSPSGHRRPRRRGSPSVNAAQRHETRQKAPLLPLPLRRQVHVL